MAKQALAAQERVLGPEHPQTLRSMASLSIWIYALGQHEAAANLTRRVLAVRQRVLGPRHPDTLDSMGKLGALLGELGQHNRLWR